jgi:hypothetical protein
MGKIVKCFFMSFVLLTIISICFNFSIAEAVDTDNDGWPDQYEEKLGADPKDSKNTPDPLDDNDLYGLVNEKERDWGTQEIIWKISDPLDSDTDNDGLNDFNEVLKGTNPLVPDSDRDGWLDKAEIDAASDPNNYSSTPKNPNP